MKIKTKEILVGNEIKITYNGKTEIGKVKAMTENGFWFKGQEIDEFIKLANIHPDYEYITGNTIHLNEVI